MLQCQVFKKHIHVCWFHNAWPTYCILFLLIYSASESVCLTMDGSGVSPTIKSPAGVDAVAEEEYASQSILLQEFTNISTIDMAWTFKSTSGMLAGCLFFYFYVLYRLELIFFPIYFLIYFVSFLLQPDTFIYYNIYIYKLL